MNRGIDYGMGTTNRDRETGIRFGVIHVNELNEWAWESFEADYGEPTCPKCGNPVEDYSTVKEDQEYETYRHSCDDYACHECKLILDGEHVYGDEPIGHSCNDGEIEATVDSYNDVFITKSPYYTYAQFCSPCAPGACHLSNPLLSVEDSASATADVLESLTGNRCYCLGHDWFEGDVAPYPVYRVSDGSLVLPS